MAIRPARVARVVLCGVLIGALVVGAFSLGTVSAASAGATSPGVSSAEAGLSGTGADATVAAPSGEQPVAAPTAGQAALQAQQNETAVQPQLLEGFDRVETRIDLAENGSASVTATYRYLRPDNDSTREWESLKTDIESNPAAYLAGERARWNDTVAAGQNATGREMAVTGFDIRTEEGMTPQAYGDVIVTFHWSSFARVEPSWIGAGDALAQFALEDGATLRISWPDGYTLQSVTPGPDDTERDTVVGWHGEETDFLEGEPWVTVLHEGSPPAEQPESDSPSALLPILAVLVVLLTLGSAAAWWIRRTDDDEPTSTAQPTEPAPSVEPPIALMSNEERVLTLLEANGGRMKQQTVVAELGWTEAKTSQVVGELREADAIEVFRLGRENVLALPDHDADATDSVDTDSAAT